MAFYARPTQLISPGDIFPEIPITVSVPPIKVARKSKYNPPAKFGPQDLRRIFKLPEEAALVANLRLSMRPGEEALVTTRVGPAIFLSWGSQVEADERDLRDQSKPKNKSWLAAPIYKLNDVPEDAVLEDPDTRERINLRDVVRQNRSHNYFFLAPFPDRDESTEYYVDFRKICSVGIAFFLDSKEKRVATLTGDTLNTLFSRLMWFFTRAEYFFQPIQCGNCGHSVSIDIRFEGQNFDAEPWE
jgi:hypothetical protein